MRHLLRIEAALGLLGLQSVFCLAVPFIGCADVLLAGAEVTSCAADGELPVQLLIGGLGVV